MLGRYHVLISAITYMLRSNTQAISDEKTKVETETVLLGFKSHINTKIITNNEKTKAIKDEGKGQAKLLPSDGRKKKLSTWIQITVRGLSLMDTLQ